MPPKRVREKTQSLDTKRTKSSNEKSGEPDKLSQTQNSDAQYPSDDDLMVESELSKQAASSSTLPSEADPFVEDEELVALSQIANNFKFSAEEFDANSTILDGVMRIDEATFIEASRTQLEKKNCLITIAARVEGQDSEGKKYINLAPYDARAKTKLFRHFEKCIRYISQQLGRYSFNPDRCSFGVFFEKGEREMGRSNRDNSDTKLHAHIHMYYNSQYGLKSFGVWQTFLKKMGLNCTVRVVPDEIGEAPRPHIRDRDSIQKYLCSADKPGEIDLLPLLSPTYFISARVISDQKRSLNRKTKAVADELTFTSYLNSLDVNDICKNLSQMKRLITADFDDYKLADADEQKEMFYKHCRQHQLLNYVNRFAKTQHDWEVIWDGIMIERYSHYDLV